jgi:uncharacterized membrane protein
MNIIKSLLLCFVLVGCAADPGKGPLIDQTQLEQAAFTARSTYAGALKLMVIYVQLPPCSTRTSVLCKTQATLDTLRQYELAADNGTKIAVNLARSSTKNPTALSSAVTDAQSVVATFQTAAESATGRKVE